MLVGTLSSLGVLNWAMNHITGICTSTAVNGFSCPYSRTHFNTSLIWGAVGPRRYFSNQIGYSALLYFFIIGAILPIPVYYLTRRYPKSLWRRIHVPLFLGGLNYLPPATGMNYGSWAVVGLTFGWLVRKRLHSWWSKYNFVLSSAMDSSVGIAGALIFLTIYFTGASKHFKWWGTDVHKVCLGSLAFTHLCWLLAEHLRLERLSTSFSTKGRKFRHVESHAFMCRLPEIYSRLVIGASIQSMPKMSALHLVIY